MLYAAEIIVAIGCLHE